MGTNYYLETDACPHCKRPDRTRHIGKSSAGWCFSLHVIPEDGIGSLEDWKLEFDKPESRIVDEYGETISSAGMLSTITNRAWSDGTWAEKPNFYGSWDEFLEKNSAEKGPLGLLRHRIDGIHCVGHGEGTWDLIAGEFS